MNKYFLFFVFLFSLKTVQSGFFNDLLDPKKSVCTTFLECLKEKLIKKGLCKACLPVVASGRLLIKKGKYSEFEKIFVLACTGTQSTNSDMCKKIYATYSDSLYKVSLQSTLSNEELCDAWFECDTVKNPIVTWEITLPNVAKPQVIKLSSPQASSPTIRILHLADIHIDYEYKPGSLGDCDQYICCRTESTSTNKANSASRLARYWGYYGKCDLPIWTVENMFKNIQNETFDIIYWTGDFSPHDVWQNSQTVQLTAIRNLTQLFKKYFPNKKIFSSIGNHESIPANLFPTNRNGGMSWLYNTLAEEWVKVGLANDTITSIQKGAFYTTVLYPGLRLISLNNMYCYRNNFWLYINSTDPLDQLDWLTKTLQASENIGEKVHIIAHINPSGCMKSFSRNYYKIVNRYESTIRGQFFGHTHYDEFEIFYDLNDKKRPTNIAYIAGSVTTYGSSNPNPSYRIYTIDGFYNQSSFQVLDYDTTILNITEANLGSSPVWIKEYSAKSAYSLKNLLPEEWSNLVNYVYKNLNGPLFEKLYKYYYKSNADPKNCDLSCRRSFVCSLKQASSEKNIPC